MEKIKTIFELDYSSGKRVVTKNPNLETAGFVFENKGIARRKLNGSCCIVIGSNLFKRSTLKSTKPYPEEFIEVDLDMNTEKIFGWVPVDFNDPCNKYHAQAWEDYINRQYGYPKTGTCELVGPKVQGNPEIYKRHTLVFHDETEVFTDVPLDFDGMKAWMLGRDIEGIVFHGPEGQMAKIRQEDLGLVRGERIIVVKPIDPIEVVTINIETEAKTEA